MASATETASEPHLRVSAAKNHEQKNASDGQQQESARVSPPESSLVEDHFFWTYTEEPHRSRRQAIIKAHPEVCILSSACDSRPTFYTPSIHVYRNPANSISNIKVTKLCGPEPLTKYVVLFVVSLQVCCAYLLRETSMLSWRFLLTAYVIGATSNQNLFLAIHEISHNLAFRSPMANRLLAIFANIPIGIPYSAAFRVCPNHYPEGK